MLLTKPSNLKGDKTSILTTLACFRYCYGDGPNPMSFDADDEIGTATTTRNVISSNVPVVTKIHKAPSNSKPSSKQQSPKTVVTSVRPSITYANTIQKQVTQ